MSWARLRPAGCPVQPGELLLLDRTVDELTVTALLLGAPSGQLESENADPVDASLVVLEFQAMPTSAAQRLKSCIVSVRFAPAQPEDPAPSVIGLAPQGSMRLFHSAPTASAGLDALLSASVDSKTQSSTESGVLLRGAVQHGAGLHKGLHLDPTLGNTALWFICGDRVSNAGLTFTLRCAVLVAHARRPFTAEVRVKTNLASSGRLIGRWPLTKPSPDGHRPVLIDLAAPLSPRLDQLMQEASLGPDKFARLAAEPSLLNRLASFRNEAAVPFSMPHMKLQRQDDMDGLRFDAPISMMLPEAGSIQPEPSAAVKPTLPSPSPPSAPAGPADTPRPGRQNGKIGGDFDPAMPVLSDGLVADVKLDDKMYTAPVILSDDDADTMVWKEGSTRDMILRDFARGHYENSYKLKRFKALRVFNIYLYQHRLVKLDEKLQAQIDQHETITDQESDALAELLGQYDTAIKAFFDLDEYDDVLPGLAEATNNALSTKLGEPHYLHDPDLSMINLNGGPDPVGRWFQRILNRFQASRADREFETEWNQSRYITTSPGMNRAGIFIALKRARNARPNLVTVPVETAEFGTVGISTTAQKLASFSVALSGGLFLLAPMCQLAYTTQLKYQIISVVLWVLIFSCSVAASNRVGNIELLGATATYAAVLVVFVGKGA